LKGPAKALAKMPVRMPVRMLVRMPVEGPLVMMKKERMTRGTPEKKQISTG
jgi:hypothetical protein